VIPITHATIAGTRIIGRLTSGYVSTSMGDWKGKRADVVGIIGIRKVY
jgi:hypothetical protein